MKESSSDILLNDPARIAFFRVPLVCEAVPQIGCGCRTKPLLTALGQHAMVSAAWLQRSGSTPAVRWKHILPANDAMRLVNAAFADEGPLEPVQEEDRLELLAALRSSSEWYSAATIDDLSREEAELIAARMVRRLRQQVTLDSDTKAKLHCAIACATLEILINDMAASVAWRRPALGRAIVDAARSHLNVHAIAVLEDIVRVTDYRPLPDEP